MKLVQQVQVWKFISMTQCENYWNFLSLFFFNVFFFSECENSKIGDSKCQDQVNVPECGFDKGDCCMAEVDKSECYSCECHFNIIPPFDPCEYTELKHFEA